MRPTASSLGASPQRWRADVRVLTGGIDWQRLRAEISRRAAGLLLSGAAWQLTTVPASAFKWATVERVAKDPALLKDVLDQDKTDAAVKRWKKSMNMVKGVDAVDAASYTAEFEEFKLAVGKVKKLKIGDVVHVVNGRPVTTPQQGAQLLREAKGVVQIVVTRLGAAPKPKEGEEAAAELSKADKTKSSFLPSMSFRPGGKKKEPDHKTDDPHNTTVVVSCSALARRHDTRDGAPPGRRRLGGPDPGRVQAPAALPRDR